ncbi:hypothetical protein F5I97DRAFT_1936902 [Phlebopus sp. FC_14]|nr:hypothetical protein F5I97DRAFT_1936902 [Phlebopus sp. FC_14]
MPPRQRNLNPSGLGRAIINRKIKDARERQESALYTTEVDSTTRLKSVTQERDLDEFLNTAQLAGTEFIAERRNVKIIQSNSGQNPYLLSESEEKRTLAKHQANKERLRVPRRPPWTKAITTTQLDRQEKDAFLKWRRGLAVLQEQEKFLLTPFERNIEVWRQLWRVLERSHLIVQIVDARNPLRFRCEDLEEYVRDVEGAEGEAGTGKGLRRNLLLVNKADLLTATQRRIWADYLDAQGIRYAFFSAANATALQQARQAAVARSEAESEAYGAKPTFDPDSSSDSVGPSTPDDIDFDGSAEEAEDSKLNTPLRSDVDNSDEEEGHMYVSTEEDSPDGRDPRTKVLNVLELEELFGAAAPDLSAFTTPSGEPPTKLVIGLVGYPNVGKSSTINALLGSKKVSVSSTPGKTKHFQTIHLTPTLILCDCPGLVFPQFATTKAALVCDGVLPIDQMREYIGPVGLVVRRIPKEVLEATYGLRIRIKGVEEGGDGKVTAEDLLVAYAIARGFMRSGQGSPDEARASRYILKDYVNGRLLFCEPPPGTNRELFNARTHELSLLHATTKERVPLTGVGKGLDRFDQPATLPTTTANASTSLIRGADQASSSKSQALDRDFFVQTSSLPARAFVQGSARHGQEFSRAQLYPHQSTVRDDGTPLRMGERMTSLDAGRGANGKKHHKKGKRIKQRSGKGYD